MRSNSKTSVTKNSNYTQFLTNNFNQTEKPESRKLEQEQKPSHHKRKSSIMEDIEVKRERIVDVKRDRRDSYDLKRESVEVKRDSFLNDNRIPIKDTYQLNQS